MATPKETIHGLPNLKITGPGVQGLIDDLRALAQREILVGYPAEYADRDDAGEGGITNAAIGYINENGDPDLNIPARPHLGPAIAEKREELALGMRAAAVAALPGSSTSPDQALHAVGLKAQAAVRNKITDGLSPPLAPLTLRNRARRGDKGAQAELDARAQGEAPSSTHAKPLFDTGELLKAINYVIRDRSQRST